MCIVELSSIEVQDATNPFTDGGSLLSLAIPSHLTLAATLHSAVKYPISGESVEVILTGTELDLSGDLVLMADYRPNSETGFSREVPRDEWLKSLVVHSLKCRFGDAQGD